MARAFDAQNFFLRLVLSRPAPQTSAAAVESSKPRQGVGDLSRWFVRIRGLVFTPATRRSPTDIGAVSPLLLVVEGGVSILMKGLLLSRAALHEAYDMPPDKGLAVHCTAPRAATEGQKTKLNGRQDSTFYGAAGL